MLCGLCKKRPVEAIIKTDEGSASLCGTCFQRYRLLKAAGEIEGLSDYFYMYDEFNPISAFMARNSEAVCPSCGMSLSRLKKDYKFGCSACYDFFSDKVEEYFDELGGQEYRGRYLGYENKKNARRKLSEMTVDDLPLLMKKLQEARDNQEMSKAEAIDRRIQQLKGGKQ
ncbi:MAG: hypothetical protein K2G42_03045 [Clostridia bacterium]|nr:hypothetical protein [Clostridia bacterium]